MTTRLMLAALLAASSLVACSHSCPTPVTPTPPAASPVHEAGPLVGYIVRFKILPGKAEAATQLIRETADKVLATEPGTLVYLFNHPADAPDDVIVVEVYANEEARKAHGDGPIMKAAHARMKEVFDLENTRFEEYDATFAGFVR